MTDSAGTAEVVTVEATLEDSAEKSSGRRKVLGAALYFLIAVAWYAIIRWAVLAVFAVPFAVLPKTQMTAAVWMLFAQPLALGIGAYLTLLSNVRNRPLHMMLTVVVFLSVVVGHVELSMLNPYIARAVDGLRIAAWLSQALVIAVFGIVGARKTKVRMPKFQKALLTRNAAASE